jgi:PAS domain S-box-containing protein
MVISNKIAFYNLYILNLLGYSDEEFKSADIYDVLYEKKKFSDFFNAGNKQEKIVQNFDTKLIKKSGELHDAFVSLSKVTFHGEEGFIIAVKDISPNKDVEYELDQNIEKFKTITNNIDIGIFRTGIGKKGRFTEINTSARHILGCSENDNIYSVNILDLFYSEKEKKEVINLLSLNKNVNKQSIKIKRLDGVVITAMVSLILATDEEGKGTFCDGIIQDITLQKKLESEKDSMIEELITTGMFMNQPVKSLAIQIPICSTETSISEAVNLMVRKKSQAILINIDHGIPVGIITNDDLVERIISKNLDLELPIAKVMSSPLISISENALLYEALLLMKEKDVNCICIEESEGDISEIVTIKDIAYAKYQTHSLLIQRIKASDSIDELKDMYDSTPVFLRMLIESGAKTDVITRINSSFTDEISLKILDMVMKDFEEPPVNFAFITLGSVGRGEQTFLTDQDNAIIYDDVEAEKEEQVKAYFVKVGKALNKGLNDVGYNYCKGEVMAGNPKWCMSASDWKKQFRSWIIHSNPQDLIDVNIFFDIKNSSRNVELTKNLQDYIFEIVKEQRLFFYHLADNVISVKPPLTFFGNFIVESTKENKSVFDIKKVIMLITGIARLYALNNDIRETNTLRRLKKLFLSGVLTEKQYNMLSRNFSYLMLMRMNSQLDAIGKNQEPNNFINPKNLTDIERTTLKKIFSQLSEFQNKISLDFKGSMK